MNPNMTIKEFQKFIADFRDKLGWTKVHSPENLAKALSVEANELLRLFLWKDHGHVEIGSTMHKECLHELADILLLCFSFVDILGGDVDHVVQEKMKLHEKKLSNKKE